MHFVLMLPTRGNPLEQLPERARAAVRAVQGLSVVDAFGTTVLVSYEGDISALKRQLPGWQIQPETWCRVVGQ